MAEITNTEYLSLSYFKDFDTLDLLANSRNSISTSSKLESFKLFLEDLATKLPANYDFRTFSSMVILNENFARLTSKKPIRKGKVDFNKENDLTIDELVRDSRPIKENAGLRPLRNKVYECQIPYSSLNLVLLDAVILDIKNPK